MDVARRVLYLAGAALDLFPQQKKHDRRQGEGGRERRVVPQQHVHVVHDLVEMPMQKKRHWRCKACWMWAATRNDGAVCPGRPEHYDAIRFQAPRAGHNLVLLVPLDDGMPTVVICANCGALGSQGTRAWSNLLASCSGHFTHRQYRTKVNHAANGQHPDRRRFGDAVLFHTPQ